MLTLGSLCSGYGGLDIAVAQVLDVRTAWVADPDPGAAAILTHHWPDVPNLGDITTVDFAQVEPVDVVCAGFPCQDLSLAGVGTGMRAGNRSGLWFQIANALKILRPRMVVIENVPGLLSKAADSDVEPCPWCLGDVGDESHLRALGAVLGDLADLGFDAQWQSVRASDVGGVHRRERVFVIAWPAADTEGERHGNAGPSRLGRVASAAVAGAPAYPSGTGREARREGLPGTGALPAAHPQGDGRNAWQSEPAGEQGRPDASVCGVPAPAQWGTYGPAVDRWARVVGRPAPHPRELAPRGGERLSPAFVEWMMGLPAGWVTDVPGLGRNEQLKALGNGVVPQQAAHALSLLLARSAVAA
jgi:DNA (cytosine-5)-methyltransferase 1